MSYEELNESHFAVPEEPEQKQSSFFLIVQKFVTRLGDPSKWTFEGEIIDLGTPSGKCTCDHPIRYVFVIHGPDGKTAPVGSECINHFQSYNPELWGKMNAARDAFWLRIREEEKARKEAQYKIDVEKNKSLWEEARKEALAQIAAYRESNGFWLPATLYSLHVKLNTKVPVYKRTKTYVSFYERETKAIYLLITRFYNETNV